MEEGKGGKVGGQRGMDNPYKRKHRSPICPSGAEGKKGEGRGRKQASCPFLFTKKSRQSPILSFLPGKEITAGVHGEKEKGGKAPALQLPAPWLRGLSAARWFVEGG